LHRRYVGDPHRLLEKIRVVVTATTPQQLTPRGTAEMQAMARAVNELAAQRDQLRGDMAAQVAQASHSVQQEKNRLAALMAELNQSVVVCNRDGRILLYNQRARQQFRQISQGPGLAAGAELIGIGRSIYAVFDQQLLAHALERIHQGMARGVASPSAQFVTTTQGGQLLRVQVAPVRAALAEGAGEETLESVVSGFVLMLDNVTASVEEEAARDQLLHGLTEGSRASLANIQAAVDMLGYSDLEPAMRERFLGVVRDEVGAMGRRITDLAQRATQRLKTRWPMEDMLGADLAAAAQRRIAAQCDRPVSLDTIDGSLWLKVDSYTLLQALTYLAHRLVDEFEVRFLQLRLQGTGTHAQLDLVW
ncbi:MAG TPA: DNA polymerase III subunit epsilon, partial [Comamonadaceae bacterium]|nr:DNA polymerase III subunit epsilon [Comamonadaceae bacterium]